MPIRSRRTSHAPPVASAKAGFTCETCFRGKIRCDKGHPCSRCARLGRDCVPHAVRPGRPKAPTCPSTPTSGDNDSTIDTADEDNRTKKHYSVSSPSSSAASPPRLDNRRGSKGPKEARGQTKVGKGKPTRTGGGGGTTTTSSSKTSNPGASVETGTSTGRVQLVAAATTSSTFSAADSAAVTWLGGEPAVPPAVVDDKEGSAAAAAAAAGQLGEEGGDDVDMMAVFFETDSKTPSFVPLVDASCPIDLGDGCCCDVVAVDLLEAPMPVEPQPPPCVLNVPKARAILLSWHVTNLLLNKDTTQGLLAAMAQSLLLVLPPSLPAATGDGWQAESSDFSHNLSRWMAPLQRLGPTHAMCVARWGPAMGSLSITVNDRFQTIFMSARAVEDSIICQGQAAHQVWARLVETHSLQAYWDAVMRAAFQLDDEEVMDPVGLTVRDKSGAVSWAMCRMGFYASASGLNSCSYIVLEPFC